MITPDDLRVIARDRGFADAAPVVTKPGKATEAPGRPLEACAAARRTDCGYCAALAGEPCAYSGTGPDGFHACRVALAAQAGHISPGDVLAILPREFSSSTLIYEDGQTR